MLTGTSRLLFYNILKHFPYLPHYNKTLPLNHKNYNFYKDLDIYLINSYGQTKSFYNNCKNVFLGGSLVDHGVQNPLEATRYGCNILHGPNISNFKEIYKNLAYIKKNLFFIF